MSHTYTIKLVDKRKSHTSLFQHKIKATKEFLVGFCMLFTTTLYSDDKDEDCVAEYHGLQITVHDDVPISLDELCEDRYLVTICAENQIDSERYLNDARKDFVKWFNEKLQWDELDVEYPYTCLLIGYNHHIYLTQFEDDDFVRGIVRACNLLEIDPASKIKQLHYKEVEVDLNSFM